MKEYSEANEAGIALIPSTAVAAPRVSEARISFECSLDRIVSVGRGAGAGNLVLGTVVLMHVKDEVLDAASTVDPLKAEAIGRLSGNRFCAIESFFEMAV